MKRKTYIAAGITMNLLQLGIPWTFHGWDILFAYLMLLAYFLIIAIIYLGNHLVPVSFWFDQYKKIYHADFGTLYTDILNDKGVDYVCIYEQRWFYMKKIAQVEYSENIQILVDRIKYNLDSIYKHNLEKSIKKNRTHFKEWDGYLDTESKRDDKLNKLGL
jgi:hypothetical protein